MAQYNLGWIYENGVYIAKNKAEATERSMRFYIRYESSWMIQTGGML